MEQLTYFLDGFWRDVGDPRVSGLPLMSDGPATVLGIVCSYLYFVRVVGPKWMKQREAFDLKWLIRFHNLVMSFFCFVGFTRCLYLTNFGMDYFGCKEVGNSRVDRELFAWGYLFAVSRLIELVDTIFFILRKKHNQASKLHVFHHSSVSICVWIFYKIAPGGSSAIFPIMNSGVHTIMYLYYFLATYKNLQPYLWWKRYLTKLQIIQFVISLTHFITTGMSSCKYPKSLAALGGTFNIVFIILFVDFYNRTYSKQQEKPAKAVDEVKKPIHQN